MYHNPTPNRSLAPGPDPNQAPQLSAEGVDGPRLGEKNVYLVERILERKHDRHRGDLYKIRWLGYGVKDDTWEPRANIDERLVRAFNAEFGDSDEEDEEDEEEAHQSPAGHPLPYAFSSAASTAAALAEMEPEEGEAAAAPDEYICPITHEIMTDPVTTQDGFTYERAEITEWLRTKDTSPKTGATLESKTLYPSHSLRSAIHSFKEARAAAAAAAQLLPSAGGAGEAGQPSGSALHAAAHAAHAAAHQLPAGFPLPSCAHVSPQYAPPPPPPPPPPQQQLRPRRPSRPPPSKAARPPRDEGRSRSARSCRSIYRGDIGEI